MIISFFFFFFLEVVVDAGDAGVDLGVIFDVGKNQNNVLESFILGTASCKSMGNDRERFVGIFGRCTKVSCSGGGRQVVFSDDDTGPPDSIPYIVMISGGKTERYGEK